MLSVNAWQTDLDAVEAKEAAHRAALKTHILALVTAVDQSKDAADTAVSALREGLTDVQRKLNETDRIQRQVCNENSLLLVLPCRRRRDVWRRWWGARAQLSLVHAERSAGR